MEKIDNQISISSIEQTYEISFDETELQKLLDLKQNITDNSLNTTSKNIVGAINEVNNKQPKYVVNDVNVNFITLPLTNNTHGIKLNLKIVIVKNGIQSAWSITSNTINIENPKFADFGTQFYCYEIGKILTDPTPIIITGSWGLGTQLVNNFRGFTYEQISDNSYVVYFLVANNAVDLNLNITSLVPTLQNELYLYKIEKIYVNKFISDVIKEVLDKY